MRIYQVDAFARGAFSGNPAAVVPLARPVDEAWMQAVALEMSLSETAFFWPEEDRYRLRWFTPTAEVELCGHATLATAHVGWESGLARPDQTIRFRSRSGPLAARLDADLVWLDFPALPPTECEAPDGLADALGETPRWLGRGRLDFLALLADEDAVRRTTPDLDALARLGADGGVGVIVTAPADAEELDFVSRYFAPSVGVAEDPATGAAHCCLAPFWAERLGRTELVAHQASARGGWLRLRLQDGRVRLGGRAVTVFEAELRPAAEPPR